MRRRQPGQVVLCVLLLAALASAPLAWAGGKDTPKKVITVSGILMDKRDDWLTVRADKEEKAVKYVIRPADKRLRNAAKRIFTISRVNLRYRLNDDTRELVSIAKAATPAKGMVTGVVLDSTDFWVLVKPRSGPPDAFATLPVSAFRGPAQAAYKATLAKLKALEKGDVVRIQFTTDFERHRILTLEKTGTAKKKKD
jgi:hypothetical protein